jgi:dihydrolipoamide dehydrogenase
MSSSATDAAANSSEVTRQVDVVIIGAGTAGQNAFKQARKQSDNVLIINEGYWTTTCAQVGCMPSKLLIAAAERAYHANNSAEFGVEATATINGKLVMQRVRKLRDSFTSYVQGQVDSWDEQQKIAGRATINQDGHVVVNDEVIAAKQVIVAAGTQPFVPEGWQDALGERLYTSDTIFEIEDLLSSMAVVGAGAIGLELAQSFARLGVKVTMFNRKDGVGGIKDAKVNEQAICCLKQELTMKLGSKITKAETVANQAVLHYTDADGEEQTWQGDWVLAATGRKNNLDGLGVENLGVTLDEKNRPENMSKNTGQIGELNVYIIGDANMHLPLLHVASDEGFSAGSVVCDDSSGAYIRPPAPPISIVFCEPQIMAVGRTLAEIEDEGLSYVIGEVDFANQGRSRIMGVDCGLLRIYGCKETDKVLGACMVGPDAEYIAHILATALTNQITVKQLLDAPFYHPTILEGLRTALRGVQDKMNIPHQTD